MPEFCKFCGRQIFDYTEICKCGHNVKADRLEQHLEVVKSALEGWSTVARRLQRWIDYLNDPEKYDMGGDWVCKDFPSILAALESANLDRYPLAAKETT
jgi:hypothetical protein